ncbi:MAG: hypothetical protein ACLGPM_02140 [Acidobacteriota bacterium]
MEVRRFSPILTFLPLLLYGLPVPAETPQSASLDLHQVLTEVQAHQKQVEALRENYTFNSVQIKQEVDGSGQVQKTESEEREQFFVNGHMIGRLVKRNGQPLSAADSRKEDARIIELVDKAQKTPPGQRLDGPSISVDRVLDLMDLRNPRREVFRGRPTIVFDFVGRRDAKTHGIMEDASKKLQGTIYIDAADLQVAHLEVRVDDDFRFGGLLASVQKGSSFRFDQAPVGRGLWLPTGSEADVEAKVLLFKHLRERVTQQDFGFQRFGVETGGEVKPVSLSQLPETRAGMH